MALLRFFCKGRCRGGVRDPPDLSRRHLFEPLVVFLMFSTRSSVSSFEPVFFLRLLSFFLASIFSFLFLGGFVGKGLLTRSRVPPSWIWSSFSFRLIEV